MNDDLAYLIARISGYRSYADEDVDVRSATDMRVRAYLGEALSAAQARLNGAIDTKTAEPLEAALLHCVFADQEFTQMLRSPNLSEAAVTALIRLDRTLVELAESLTTIEPAALYDTARRIDATFEQRRVPTNVTA